MNPQLPLSSFPIQHDVVSTNTLTNSGQQDRWAQWFQEGNLVALERTVPDDSESKALAWLCLQNSETRPHAVDAVLFAHKSVRLQSHELFQAGRADDHLQRSLAQRLLNAGFPFKCEDLSSAVMELVQERLAWRETYWKGKVDQYKNVKDCEELVPGPMKHGGFFYGVGRPYFHFSPDYQTFNVNCRIEGGERIPLECRHLELLVQRPLKEGGSEGEFKPEKALWNKDFLREISRVDRNVPRLNRLSYWALEAEYKKNRFAPTINFSPEHFGVLLRKLLSLSRDLPCSFGVGWWFSRGGHAMRVFMERSTTAPFWVKVGLYEPNVSGDVSHLKVLPEDLCRLDFHDFDKLKMCEAYGVSVLSLKVDDPALSRACAGHFVNQDVDSQLASLEQGLNNCSAPEIEQAMARLRQVPSFDAPRVKQFGLCLRAATVGEMPERYAGFQFFLEGLRSLALTPDQLTEVLSDAGPSCGLPWLFAGKCHAPMVEVLMRCLKKLNLSRDQAFKVLRGGEVFRMEEGAYIYGADTTLQIFRSGLQDWGFSAEQIVGLLTENCGDLASKGEGMIVAGMTGLRELGLSSDQIARMLTPRPSRSGKASSLCCALQRWDKGGAESVKAFMAGLKSLSLAAEHNLAILAPEHFGGAAGLRKVLDGVSDEARATFLADMADLDMPLEAREALAG